MEYQVPQFIEVEDKILGPFTLKQFIYLAGGAGLCAIVLLYLPLFLGVLIAIPVAAFAGALAFYRVNNKPFIDILEAGFNYYTKGRLYLWRKEKPTAEPVQAPDVASAAPTPARPQMGLSKGKLEELAWSLDVKDTGQNPS